MGKVVTVMNMKGGVGKTTVAIHLGGALGKYKWAKETRGRSVLLIDYDPQFNLSQAYISAKNYFSLESNKKTILSVLQEPLTALDPYKLQVPGTSTPPSVNDLAVGIGGYVDVVPSTLDLMYVALGRSDVSVKVIEARFEKFMQECREEYDLVIIDCHPAGSLMTKTALLNSDHVLIPVVPERYAVRGIGLMLDFMGSKQQGKTGPTPHILFNKAPRVGQSPQEIEIRASKTYSNLCLVNTMKKYKAYSDPEEGKNFIWTSGKAYSTEARQNLWSISLEFAKRIGVYYGP